MIKNCLNDFDENFATRLITNYCQIISKHNEYPKTWTTDFYMTLQQVTKILQVNEELFYKYSKELTKDLLTKGRLLDELKEKGAHFVTKLKAQEPN